MGHLPGHFQDKIKSQDISRISRTGDHPVDGLQTSCTLSGENSSFKIVKCGVPQGSCIGPLLFLIYINNLQLVLRRAIPSMFADDTSTWAASDSV